MVKFDLSFQGFSEEIETLPEIYSPPEGALILARADGEAAGCVALRKPFLSRMRNETAVCPPSYRGMGIGKQLVARIIEEAIKRHYQFMRLDTLPLMKDVERFIRIWDFILPSPYYDNPIVGAEFMELNLRTGQRREPAYSSP